MGRAILAIDPGPVKSGLVEMYIGNGGVPSLKFCGVVENPQVLSFLRAGMGGLGWHAVVIEYPQCMGMVASQALLDTAGWAGRFEASFALGPSRHGYGDTHRVKRTDVKLHLCGTCRAKDSNVRQALIDRWGPRGTKKEPGPTYGIAGDAWAALAVATYWLDTHTAQSGADIYIEELEG